MSRITTHSEDYQSWQSFSFLFELYDRVIIQKKKNQAWPTIPETLTLIIKVDGSSSRPTSLHQWWQPHLHPCFLYNSKMVPSITPDYHQHANVPWSLLDSLFEKNKILSKLFNKKVGNEKVILKMNLIHYGWEPDEHLFYAVQLRLNQPWLVEKP
jgi:hypothetical protein